MANLIMGHPSGHYFQNESCGDTQPTNDWLTYTDYWINRYVI